MALAEKRRLWRESHVARQTPSPDLNPVHHGHYDRCAIPFFGGSEHETRPHPLHGVVLLRAGEQRCAPEEVKLVLT